ncbi:MAG: hypothetical protein JRG97_03295 [Deltaproteobacteria bacterium]|nr:hypothetical protein [Deltaproteobacteria bacterium]MBW2051998.1 hypothetical protein [Deltaproteobacteria bacterium]MBW2140083.1 hypothetical protein [Deltaproteobacteria bacterium]MBW2323754.1 hypothetical protein [Deltaproteobacteria bacterium]
MFKLSKKIILAAIFLSAFLLQFSGCAYFQREIEPAETASTVKYYHFEDIRIPAELKLDERRSFIHDMAGFKAGTLYFTGYVNSDSLVAFFKDSMLNDGWELKSTFRYPKTLHLFEKSKKICIIIIKEELLTTKVEIWVSPLL